MDKKSVYCIVGGVLAFFIWYALSSDTMIDIDRYFLEKRLVLYPSPNGTVWMSPKERIIYGATHFWDHLGFSDSTFFTSDKKDMEVFWVDYQNLLLFLPDGLVKDSIIESTLETIKLEKQDVLNLKVQLKK